jgi:hypothetical protein
MVPVSSAMAMNWAGSKSPRSGMLPARQNLVAGNLLRREVYERLVVGEDRAFDDGALDVALELDCAAAPSMDENRYMPRPSVLARHIAISAGASSARGALAKAAQSTL